VVTNGSGFPTANGRQSIIRSVGEALDQIERCAELVGDNQEVQALLDAASDKLRRTMRDLRRELSPLGEVALDARDLRASLHALVAQAQQVLGMQVEAYLDEAVSRALPPDQACHLLHVVREALANAILHAGAARMALRAQVENGRLVIRLSDDGCGFDVRAARAAVRGGLALMHQHAAAANGLLQVESVPGAGTIVTLTVDQRPFDVGLTYSVRQRGD
jgi:signal transduction histidine kinase